MTATKYKLAPLRDAADAYAPLPDVQRRTGAVASALFIAAAVVLSNKPIQDGICHTRFVSLPGQIPSTDDQSPDQRHGAQAWGYRLRSDDGLRHGVNRGLSDGYQLDWD